MSGSYNSNVYNNIPYNSESTEDENTFILETYQQNVVAPGTENLETYQQNVYDKEDNNTILETLLQNIEFKNSATNLNLETYQQNVVAPSRDNQVLETLLQDVSI